jgi:hypothetical protein
MKCQIAAYIHITEILPPGGQGREACICCGRRSRIDEDGCGICDECLGPDAPTDVATDASVDLAEKSTAAEFVPPSQPRLG